MTRALAGLLAALLTSAAAAQGPPTDAPPGRAMIEAYFRLQVQPISDRCLADLTTRAADDDAFRDAVPAQPFDHGPRLGWAGRLEAGGDVCGAWLRDWCDLEEAALAVPGDGPETSGEGLAMAAKMAGSGKVAVRYASGREDQYEVELYGGGNTGELRLKELIKAPAVLLQTETELLIIPWAAVERVTIALPQTSGKQEPLPGVRRARRLT